MEATPDIFSKVSDYLEYRITLEELEDWLVRNLGLFLSPPSKEAPDDASELAGTIELGLAEMSKGHRTEEEFRALVGEFIRSRDFVFVSPAKADRASSACITQDHKWAPTALYHQQHQEWKYADIELGMAS